MARLNLACRCVSCFASNGGRGHAEQRAHAGGAAAVQEMIVELGAEVREHRADRHRHHLAQPTDRG